MQRRNVRQRRGRMSDEEVSKFVKGLSKTGRRFEDQWLVRFSKGLEEAVGNETRKRVLR